MSLVSYLDDLEPDERPLAREWGTMDSDEFQARMGPEMSRMAAAIEVSPRWYNLRVSEIARLAVAAAVAVVGKGTV